MKISILLAFILLPFLSYSNERDSLSNNGQYLGISSGLGYYRIRDVQESSLMYQNSYFPILLNYNYNAQRFIHSINFQYFSDTLKSSISSGSINVIAIHNFEINYNCLYKTNTTILKHFNICFGGNLSNLLSIRTHILNTTGITKYNNYETFSDVGLAIGIINDNIANTKWGIKYIASISVLSYVLFRRYDYNGVFNNIDNLSPTFFDLFKAGEWLTLNHFIDFQSSLQAERQLYKRIYFNVEYLFRYVDYNQYNNLFPVKIGINQFSIGLKYKL